MTPRPTFAVIAGTESAADRRLITVAMVRALTGLSVADIGDDGLALMIDATLASCARYCRLAKAGAQPPTFAQESVRATWPELSARYPDWPLGDRGQSLLLPWRVPITEVSVTEGDTDLEQDVDFRLLGAGVIERLSGCWSTGPIVVDYTAGWVAPPDDASEEPDGEPMPADLVALIAGQVKLSFLQQGQDPTLRSEDVPGVWSGSYNVPGGDSISAFGLGVALQTALDAYRAPLSFA